jgi:thiol:disulfide interchange protein DsbD
MIGAPRPSSFGIYSSAARVAHGADRAYIHAMRLLLPLLLLAPAAHALESAPATSQHDTATLVSDADSFSPGKPLRLGLRIKLQPGWHTYWSNPGDAGAPPTLEVKGATAGPIIYPTPEKLIDGPFTSFAYTNEVTLPFIVTPPPGTAPLSIDAHATFLACEKVCVPEDAALHLDIPQGSGAPGPQAALFTAADANTPRPSPFHAAMATDGALTLDAPGLRPKTAYFFPDEAGVFDQGAPQPFDIAAAGLTLHLKPLGKLDTAKPVSGVLALTDQGGETSALRIDAGKPAAAPAPTHSTGLLNALLLAFAGGLILNLMPCVLPVLAIKALSLAKLSGVARGRVRREAALYTAGVLAAFGAIGVVTLTLGALGQAAGWGTQFHSTIFTALIVWLMLLIGLNLSGVFEFGAGLAGAGQGLASRGSFFTGLLAVVVATPCTAPFMATALAAAAALPPLAGMMIFLSLGLGLAAPYGMLALVPHAARLLPRPGAWMEKLKNILALPMYATAAFFAWVVYAQSGPLGAGAVLAGAALLGLAAFTFGREQRRGDPSLWRHAAGAVSACIVLMIGLSLYAGTPQAMASNDGSEPFSPARLAALRQAHRPVLVDMTAAWCITCLVNERVALSPAPVRTAFAKNHVAYLKGDWTRQDPAITAFLRQYDRSGVPLYVFFPAQGDPQILPQILTQADIIGRLGG